MKKISLSIFLSLISFVMLGRGFNEDVMKLLSGRYNVDEPGGAVLIAKGDKILFEYYAGLADLQTKTPITKNTRFNIASISKQFTTVSILKLQDEKLLSIDDSMIKYMDNLDTNVFGGVTLSHIMSHSSGIPDDRPRSNRKWMLEVTDEESIKYLKQVKHLHFSPGTEYEYINPTFQILYAIIEKISGESFIDFQQHNIFSKAGMNNTFYFDANIEHTNVSHGYVMEEKQQSGDRDVVKENVFTTSGIADKRGNIWHEYDYGEETFFATKADGGIYSTPRDLLAWHRALKSGSIISSESLSETYKTRTVVSGSKYCTYQNRPNTYYGLGFFIERTPKFPVKIYHTGDNGGYQAYLAYFPEKDVSVIILENRNDYDRWSLVKQIDNLLNENGII